MQNAFNWFIMYFILGLRCKKNHRFAKKKLDIGKILKEALSHSIF